MIAAGCASLHEIALRLPVFLSIELHPRVPAGHRHDAGRVPTNVAIAFLKRAHLIKILLPVRLSARRPGRFSRFRSIGSPRRR